MTEDEPRKFRRTRRSVVPYAADDELAGLRRAGARVRGCSACVRWLSLAAS